MNWVDTNERLPVAKNDFYVVSVTKGNFTFLAVAFYMKDDNKWLYMDKGSPGEEVTDEVIAWAENHSTYTR